MYFNIHHSMVKCLNCVFYWHWLYQVIIFIKKLLMFLWFMKPFFFSSYWPLRLNSLKGSIYYFNNNIFYKYIGITWQKDLFNGWQNITNTQKTEDWDAQTQLKIRTDMNSDALYESAVRTSLIPLHGGKALPT